MSPDISFPPTWDRFMVHLGPGAGGRTACSLLGTIGFTCFSVIFVDFF